MATRKKSGKVTFEGGMAQLEALIARMEQGEMTLDESMHAYEDGMALYGQLSQMLEQGEARMAMIDKESREGVQTTTFEVEHDI